MCVEDTIRGQRLGKECGKEARGKGEGREWEGERRGKGQEEDRPGLESPLFMCQRVLR